MSGTSFSYTSVPENTKPETPETPETLKTPVWAIIMSLLCWVVSAGLAVGHHFFNRAFSQHPAEPLILLYSSTKLSFSQQWALTIGNSFSMLVHILLPNSLSYASTQFFWYRWDAQADKLDKEEKNYLLGSLMSPLSRCCGSPIRPYIAFLSIFAALIPIFASPSLTTALYPVAKSCNISTVELATSNLLHSQGSIVGPVVGAVNLAVKTLVSGSYLTPPSPCGDCSYNTTFWAPALNCTPLASADPFPADPPGQTVFWNSTINASGGYYELVVMTRQGNQGSANQREIVSCPVYNATYNVRVNHSIPIHIAASVGNLSVYASPGATGNANSTQGRPLDALMLALFKAIEGPIAIDNTNNALIRGISLVEFSPIGSLVNATWGLKGGLSETTENLMKIFTISLLAGSIGDTGSSSAIVPAQCNINTLVYIYHPLRLWLTYSIALGISAVTAIGLLLWCKYSRKDEMKKKWRTLEYDDLIADEGAPLKP